MLVLVTNYNKYLVPGSFNNKVISAIVWRYSKFMQWLSDVFTTTVSSEDEMSLPQN